MYSLVMPSQKTTRKPDIGLAWAATARTNISYVHPQDSGVSREREREREKERERENITAILRTTLLRTSNANNQINVQSTLIPDVDKDVQTNHRRDGASATES